MNLVRLGILILLCITLASCGPVGPDYQRPEIETPATWTGELQGDLTAAQLEPTVLSDWWKTLNDETLTSLIDRAIAANLDLRAAEAQVRQARAQRNIAGASRFPTIDAGAAAGRSRGSDNVGGGGTSELYSTSFDASWELDIFGGQRRQREAAEADLQAAKELRRDVLITVLSEVALNYVELRTFQSQLIVAEDNLRIQEETLEIVQAQYDLGKVTKLDLDRATVNVFNTRSAIPNLAQNIARAKNRLAILLGQAPGSLNTELNLSQSLPKPDVQVVLGVPAETIRRRPDVRQSERQLAAETARIGVATADLYPKFTLNGTIGLESLSSGNLFESASRTFALGSGANFNVFDGGRIRQRIEVQNALQEQAMINYESRILTALEDVENAIVAFTQEQIRYQSLNESAEAAQSAADIAKERYKAGATNFLTVLDAERELLTVQDRRSASKGTIVSNLIRLYKSLGGGWETEYPEI